MDRDRAASEAGVGPAERTRRGRVGNSSKPDPHTIAGITLTNPDRVLYDAMDLTKLRIAQYYESIAAIALPHVAARPLSIVRCPRGRTDGCFYQKHPDSGFPKAVKRVPIREEESGEVEEYGMIDSPDGLVALVQMGVLEVHVWGARTDRIERPDRIVFDLDPAEQLAWERVIEASLDVRDLLSDLGLESFVKTTGGKGLHVVVPIDRRHEWPVAYDFARAIAVRLADGNPRGLTASPRKAHRKGRVFVDYLRNHRGATCVAPYSTRARPGAPVSVPIDWKELGDGVRSDQWNVETLPERLTALDEDPWAAMTAVRQSLRAEILREMGVDRG